MRISLHSPVKLNKKNGSERKETLKRKQNEKLTKKRSTFLYECHFDLIFVLKKKKNIALMEHCLHKDTGYVRRTSGFSLFDLLLFGFVGYAIVGTR